MGWQPAWIVEVVLLDPGVAEPGVQVAALRLRRGGHQRGPTTRTRHVIVD
jgi:hypothetical protein